MKFDDYKSFLAQQYLERLSLILLNGNTPKEAELLAPFNKDLVRENLKVWGFSCVSDAIDAAMPKAETLTLKAWSKETITHKGYTFEVTCEPFGYDCNLVHFTFRNKGEAPLPFTDTGYYSAFVPINSFTANAPSYKEANSYIEYLFEKVESYVPDAQLSLF